MKIGDTFSISSAMVIEKPPPNWLWSWLQIEFYKDELKCEKHVHKYKTVFCTECLEEPVCELCWKESIEEHKDHPYLQVLIASRRASVATKEIKKYLDVAHIQQYKINGKDIIYLSTNVGGAVTKKIVGGAGEPKINPECDICKKKLIESKYIFCSIECKSTCIEWYIQTREHSINGRKLEATSIQLPEPTPPTPTPSMRKRSRKGIPQRAASKSDQNYCKRICSCSNKPCRDFIMS